MITGVQEVAQQYYYPLQVTESACNRQYRISVIHYSTVHVHYGTMW